MEIVNCPDHHHCSAPAEVLDRWDFRSTDGPIEYVKTLCLDGHSFTVAAASLTGAEPAGRSTSVTGSSNLPSDRNGLDVPRSAVAGD